MSHPWIRYLVGWIWNKELRDPIWAPKWAPLWRNGLAWVEPKTIRPPSFEWVQLSCTFGVLRSLIGDLSRVELFCEGGSLSSGEVVFVKWTVVMSWMLGRLLSLSPEFSLRKYFWAWLATWVGVLVMTNFLEMFLQSPLPCFWRPIRNRLCSSSVHGTPFFLSWSNARHGKGLFLNTSNSPFSISSNVKEEVKYPGTGTRPASISLTSDSSSMYCLLTSRTDFPGIMAATFVHRSGVFSSYIARALSNFLFSSLVHSVLLLSSCIRKFIHGKYEDGNRVSISYRTEILNLWPKEELTQEGNIVYAGIMVGDSKWHRRQQNENHLPGIRIQFFVWNEEHKLQNPEKIPNFFSNIEKETRKKIIFLLAYY